MRTRIGELTVEITRPESAKFRHPLLLLHGLWAGAWVWEPLATYLAHRGWESWAPSLVQDGRRVDDTSDLDALLRALPAVPVIVSHDAGVLTAATCARLAAPPALVAIAPLESRDGTRRDVFASPQFWRARLVGATVAPPRGAAAAAFLGGASGSRDRLRDESGVLFRTIAGGRACVASPADVPGLVVVGDDDAIVGATAARALADRCGWTYRSYRGRGHFPMLEAGWETLADDVHRWIVRTLGASLLALLEDDDAADPL